jgi:SAM-dependent methyltransferase
MLDVGCGDIEIVRGLRYEGAYTGVDIADVVVRRNRQLKPEWTFLEGDFVELDRAASLAADFVVCCDVLIHQHGRDEYMAMVEALVRTTRKVGVIAAYENEPPPQFSSDITAWHEPITTTLRRAGARDVNVVGEYRGTAVVVFGPPA